MCTILLINEESESCDLKYMNNSINIYSRLSD